MTSDQRDAFISALLDLTKQHAMDIESPSHIGWLDDWRQELEDLLYGYFGEQFGTSEYPDGQET